MTTMQDSTIPPRPDDYDQILRVIELPPDPTTDTPPFVDLAPIFAGDNRQEVPTVAKVTAHNCFLYAGRINELHASPSVGKTNVAVAIAIRTLAQGKEVIIIDPEDTPPGYVRRLASFGCPADFADRIHYLHNPTPEEIQAAILWADLNRERVGLVIIDGMAEIMAAAGMSEDGSADCIMFLRQYVRPFADSGIAVLLSDHVVKSTENRGGFSRGSGAKLGRYDGIVYEVLEGKNYTPTEAGYVKLKISKDRQGGVGPRGKIAYEVHFLPKQDADGEPSGTAIEFRVPVGGEEFRPTAIMGKIVSHLETFGSETKSGIAGAINCQRKDVFTAIEVLLRENAITMEVSGKSHILRLNKKTDGITIHDY